MFHNQPGYSKIKFLLQAGHEYQPPQHKYNVPSPSGRRTGRGNINKGSLIYPLSPTLSQRERELTGQQLSGKERAHNRLNKMELKQYS
jgi:hypothetical protein